jgi:hypothetical protein
MAAIDIDPKVVVVGIAALAVAYLYTLKKTTGILDRTGRTLTSGTRGVYRDVKSVYRTGYSDVGKPVGRALKSTAGGAKKQVKKLGGWLKRRF